MDDPFVVKRVDGFSSPVERMMSVSMGPQCSTGSSNLDVGMPFDMGYLSSEPQKRPLASVTSPHIQTMNKFTDGIAGYERFSKLPKLESWGVSCGQQRFGDMTSFQQPTSSSNLIARPSISPRLGTPNRTMEGFLASFPVLKDENIAPRTPSFQFEVSFTDGQKSSTADVHSGVSTATKEASLSPSDSLCAGGQRLGFSTMSKDLSGMNGSSALQKSGNDHIMAERKRREKLSQRFIALSAIVPGLKKVPYYLLPSPLLDLVSDCRQQ